MPATIKPANPQQTATRKKELFLAFVTKVFEAMKKDGTKTVKLTDALSQRSEILLGLRESGESVQDAQIRIVDMFAEKYPYIWNSDAVDGNVD